MRRVFCPFRHGSLVHYLTLNTPRQRDRITLPTSRVLRGVLCLLFFCSFLFCSFLFCCSHPSAMRPSIFSVTSILYFSGLQLLTSPTQGIFTALRVFLFFLRSSALYWVCKVFSYKNVSWFVCLTLHLHRLVRGLRRICTRSPFCLSAGYPVS